MMEHNPYNFKVGDHSIDPKTNDEICIAELSVNQIMATVYNAHGQYKVMTKTLKPL